MKKPEDCTDLGEVRSEIDRIDYQIIQLLGHRSGYVKAASQFKTSEQSVKAPERVKAMFVQRRTWAEAAGLNPSVIEKIYQYLINHFIEQELNHWKNTDTMK
jgi:isochorismate pyruvate lyase